MVPSRGYQLFISGCKLMACGRFFSPPWDSDECGGLFCNVPIILGLSPCDLRNSHDDALQGHTLRIPVRLQSVSGPIFIRLPQFLGGPESRGRLLRRLRRWPAPLCSGNCLFPVFILSSQSRSYHFQRCLGFPQNRKASGMWDFQSVALLHCF